MRNRLQIPGNINFCLRSRLKNLGAALLVGAGRFMIPVKEGEDYRIIFREHFEHSVRHIVKDELLLLGMNPEEVDDVLKEMGGQLPPLTPTPTAASESEPGPRPEPE